MSFIEPIPKSSTDLEKLYYSITPKILQGSVNFSSPQFMAFPDCGNAIAAISVIYFWVWTNQNLINSVHTSPTATFAEIAVINWLREIVGYQVFR